MYSLILGASLGEIFSQVPPLEDTKEKRLRLPSLKTAVRNFDERRKEYSELKFAIIMTNQEI
jgi:hypothetical protein